MLINQIEPGQLWELSISTQLGSFNKRVLVINKYRDLDRKIYGTSVEIYTCLVEERITNIPHWTFNNGKLLSKK